MTMPLGRPPLSSDVDGLLESDSVLFLVTLSSIAQTEYLPQRIAVRRKPEKDDRHPMLFQLWNSSVALFNGLVCLA